MKYAIISIEIIKINYNTVKWVNRMNKEDLKAIAELLDTKLEPIKKQLEELEPIKSQLNKNTIILEEVKSDIKTIVEV